MKRLVLVLVFSSAAWAGDAAPVASATGTAAVLEKLRKNELRAALVLAAPGRDALERPGSDAAARRLGLAWAVVRASCLSLDARDDEAEVRRSLALASERALPEDLGLLRELAAASDRAAPYARAITRAASAKIDARSDRRALIDFLRGDDETAKRRAIAALGERLGKIRAKVETGDDLDAVDQAEIADPALIGALVDELSNRQEAADALAHDLGASATPSALHALALIEAPAIPALEAAKRGGKAGAGKALAAVLEAAHERLRRYPRSTWASARGALPQIVPDAIACTACRKPLPEGARFCPACGASAPGAPCPRCGQTAVSEICPRCGGVASPRVTPRACEKCGETIGAGDRFCRRCGISLVPAVPERLREPSTDQPASRPK